MSIFLQFSSAPKTLQQNLLVCSSVIIIGATGGKYGVFLLLAILLNARITKESQQKYKQYSNKGRI
ncbi:hypothetical protein [Bacillus pseudomycoides]|uniref:hypothetical protein n=1 Tax=Bacillus pseudomycoides TaxID=64104 RepID=UPI000BFE53BB|nr:hypothetical protein [Bacillus pseudomycoides]MED1625256.1 hypothetical protein [Bacillus pseudomycoides]PHC31696.1 hypothetical protein COF01_27020 [Bacillus pseudomycoides]